MSPARIANRDELKAIDDMPVEIKFMAHTILAVRNKVRESDAAKDFKDWTIKDIENSLERSKGAWL